MTNLPNAISANQIRKLTQSAIQTANSTRLNPLATQPKREHISPITLKTLCLVTIAACWGVDDTC